MKQKKSNFLLNEIPPQYTIVGFNRLSTDDKICQIEKEVKRLNTMLENLKKKDQQRQSIKKIQDLSVLKKTMQYS